MIKEHTYISDLEKKGFAVLDQIYTDSEIEAMIATIEKATTTQQLAESSVHLFAIRQVIKKIPELKPLVFTEKLKTLLYSIFEETYFLTKAIYFDKPSESN